MKYIFTITFVLFFLSFSACTKKLKTEEELRLEMIQGKWDLIRIEGWELDENGELIKVTQLKDIDNAESEILFFKTNNTYSLNQPQYSEVGTYTLHGDSITFVIGADKEVESYALIHLSVDKLVIDYKDEVEDLRFTYLKIEK